MITARNFLSDYSPLVTLGVTITGIFVMAACIGVSLQF